MIVALRREGAAASLSALRKRSTIRISQPSRSISRSLDARLTTSRAHIQLSRSTLIHESRAYSTSYPPADKRTSGPPPDPILPIQPRSRKVDLKPGPVKPKASISADTHASARPTPSLAHTPADATSTAQSNSSASPTSEGAISATRHDLEAAAQHGILAPPPPNAGRIGKLFHQAKELFKFYWRGLKLINTNRKRVNEMQERVRKGGPPLTRWEYRFIRTYNEDALKLIPFALIILIAEEVIPLVVMYTPGILPSTCILPAQKERIDNNRREKQRAYASSMRDVFERIRQQGEASAVTTQQLLDGPGLVAVSGLLGHSKYNLGVLRARKIRRHLLAVTEDDALMYREGAGSHLTPAELLEALGERGIVTEGLSLQQQRSRLRWWLTQVEGSSPNEKQHSYNTDPIVRRLVLISRSVVGHH